MHRIRFSGAVAVRGLELADLLSICNSIEVSYGLCVHAQRVASPLIVVTLPLTKPRDLLSWLPVSQP